MGRGRHAERLGGRMRRAGVRILAATLVVAGIGLCAYPAIAEWDAARRHAEVISGHDAAVSAMERDDREAMLADVRAYNAALAGEAGAMGGSAGSVGPVGPDGSAGSHDGGATGPDGGVGGAGSRGDGAILRRYDDLLNPNGDGVMGMLAIPKIDVRLPIRHGVDDAALADAVGHDPGSALPIGGDGNRSILAGHRGLPSAELFTRLDELVAGDTFSITVLGTTRVYRVTDIRVVDPQWSGAAGIAGVGSTGAGAGPTDAKSAGAGDPDTSAADNPLAPIPGRDLITLVTCTPYGVNTHRLLVTGERARDLESGRGKGSGNALVAGRSAHAPVRIPTSVDAWFRSGWAAAFAVALTLGVAAVAAVVRTVSRRVCRRGSRRRARSSVPG